MTAYSYNDGLADGILRGRQEAAAEIERLRAERDQWKSDCELRSQTASDRLEALVKLEREVERLRAALQAIADNTRSEIEDDVAANRASEIAYRALEQETRKCR